MALVMDEMDKEDSEYAILYAMLLRIDIPDDMTVKELKHFSENRVVAFQGRSYKLWRRKYREIYNFLYKYGNCKEIEEAQSHLEKCFDMRNPNQAYLERCFDKDATR